MSQDLAARIEEARRQLPDVIGEMARVVVDNPKPLLMVSCGSYVLTRVLMRAVRPHGLFGVLAVGVVSAGLGGLAARELAARGVLEFRVRDDNGDLVPVSGLTEAPEPEPCPSTTG